MSQVSAFNGICHFLKFTYKILASFSSRNYLEVDVSFKYFICTAAIVSYENLHGSLLI